MSGSRSARSARLAPVRSCAKPPAEGRREVAELADEEALVMDEGTRQQQFAELLELARAPLVATGIDEPVRPGGIDWGEEGAVPERVPRDASPWDILRRTQKRRERQRREEDRPTLPESSALPDGVYRLGGGRTLHVQRALAASALGEYGRRFPAWK